MKRGGVLPLITMLSVRLTKGMWADVGRGVLLWRKEFPRAAFLALDGVDSAFLCPENHLLEGLKTALMVAADLRDDVRMLV